jgi:hypothetical protein
VVAVTSVPTALAVRRSAGSNKWTRGSGWRVTHVAEEGNRHEGRGAPTMTGSVKMVWRNGDLGKVRPLGYATRRGPDEWCSREPAAQTGRVRGARQGKVRADGRAQFK